MRRAKPANFEGLGIVTMMRVTFLISADIARLARHKAACNHVVDLLLCASTLGVLCTPPFEISSSARNVFRPLSPFSVIHLHSDQVAPSAPPRRRSAAFLACPNTAVCHVGMRVEFFERLCSFADDATLLHQKGTSSCGPASCAAAMASSSMSPNAAFGAQPATCSTGILMRPNALLLCM